MTITHFVKFVTRVFPLHMAVGIMSADMSSHGDIAELNKLVTIDRQLIAVRSKTANWKAVSVTRAEVMFCDLIVEQNIPLATVDTLKKTVKLIFPTKNHSTYLATV